MIGIVDADGTRKISGCDKTLDFPERWVIDLRVVNSTLCGEAAEDPDGRGGVSLEIAANKFLDGVSL